MSGVDIVTFGCRLNAAESAAMRGLAERAGVDRPERSHHMGRATVERSLVFGGEPFVEVVVRPRADPPAVRLRRSSPLHAFLASLTRQRRLRLSDVARFYQRKGYVAWRAGAGLRRPARLAMIPLRNHPPRRDSE